MRHKKVGRKFNRDTKARKSLFLILSKNLIEKEQIKTTLPKAKDLRSVVEKLVTRAKVDSVANRRLVAAELGNAGDETVKKLFEVLGPRYKDRPGGYTRVLKAGFRYGDAAPMAIIEFVERDENAKKMPVKTLDKKDSKPAKKIPTDVKPAKAVKAPAVKPIVKTSAPKVSAPKKEVAIQRRATGK